MENKEHHSITLNSRVVFTGLDGDLIIELHEIVSVQGADNKAIVHLAENNKHKRKEIVLCKTLKEIEHVLPAEHFIRIHKSWIAAQKHIIKHIKIDGHQLLLSNNQQVPVADARFKQVFEAIVNYKPPLT